MRRAMRIPRTLMPEVVSQVVMSLKISGMVALLIQCQILKSLPVLYQVRFRACGREEKGNLKDFAICNLKICILHRRSTHF
jgi:hypothetical protein